MEHRATCPCTQCRGWRRRCSDVACQHRLVWQERQQGGAGGGVTASPVVTPSPSPPVKSSNRSSTGKRRGSGGGSRARKHHSVRRQLAACGGNAASGDDTGAMAALTAAVEVDVEGFRFAGRIGLLGAGSTPAEAAAAPVMDVGNIGQWGQPSGGGGPLPEASEEDAGSGWASSGDDDGSSGGGDTVAATASAPSQACAVVSSPPTVAAEAAASTPRYMPLAFGRGVVGPNGEVRSRASLARIGLRYRCSKCGEPKRGHTNCVKRSPAAVASAATMPPPALSRAPLPSPAAMPKAAAQPASAAPFCPSNDIPTNSKTLLASGVLEGLRVQYQDRSHAVWLTGTVRQGGICCDCRLCKGQEIVTVTLFENHAGSNARHPSEYIHLENGRCFRDVIEAAAQAKGDRAQALANMRAVVAGLSILAMRDNAASRQTCGGDGRPESWGLPVETGASAAWAAEELRGSAGAAEHLQRLAPPLHQARVKIRDAASQHKALFLKDGLPDGVELAYILKGQTCLSGVKQGIGILCECCQAVVSCSQFELHAGHGTRRNPYNSIYLKDGRSLHEVAVVLTSELTDMVGGSLVIGEDGSADTCGECGDGGELVLCDRCPAAYHPECVGLSSIPGGEWYCPVCCGSRTRSAVGARNLLGRPPAGGAKGGSHCKKGLDEAEVAVDRCRRLLNELENVGGGCVICRCTDFTKGAFGERTIMLCDQCEREFHVGCLRDQDMADLRELPEDNWFCSNDCSSIHVALQDVLEMGPAPLDNLRLADIKAVGPISTTDISTWQLLKGRRGDPANGVTLASVVNLFASSFDPIVDAATGKDLIPTMVHSRNTRDHEFGGMHCFVVKSKDKIVSAACVRFFGRMVAEVPLVATCTSARRQGHCRSLMSTLELLLLRLGVKMLLLPAAEGAEHTWLNAFNFKHIPGDKLRRLQAELQFLVFPGSSMLYKEVMACSSQHTPRVDLPSEPWMGFQQDCPPMMLCTNGMPAKTGNAQGLAAELVSGPCAAAGDGVVTASPFTIGAQVESTTMQQASVTTMTTDVKTTEEIVVEMQCKQDAMAVLGRVRGAGPTAALVCVSRGFARHTAAHLKVGGLDKLPAGPAGLTSEHSKLVAEEAFSVMNSVSAHVEATEQEQVGKLPATTCDGNCSVMHAYIEGSRDCKSSSSPCRKKAKSSLLLCTSESDMDVEATAFAYHKSVST
eukprot:SM000029S10454  [mRNA]  locus=s29:203685:210571:- [translate_table: standard]